MNENQNCRQKTAEEIAAETKQMIAHLRAPTYAGEDRPKEQSREDSEPSYSEKLKDPRWQRRRLEIMDRDHWQCQVCGSGKKTLNVHHTRYVRGWEPWEYPTLMLVTLCEDCHGGIHKSGVDSLPGLLEEAIELRADLALRRMELDHARRRFSAIKAGYGIEILTKLAPLHKKLEQLSQGELAEHERLSKEFRLALEAGITEGEKK